MSIELGSIVSIAKGKKHDNVFPSNGIGKKRYIQIEDLRNDDNLKYTDDTGVDVSENDMIIAWDGANAGTIGFGLNGFIGSTLARLRFKEKGFDTNYLGWFLRSKSDYLRSKCTGATIPHINKSALESLKIPKLDLKNQQEIAHVLEQADKACQQRKAVNALTDQFLQSSFLSLFGDPVKNEKGWEAKTIGDSDCKVQIGPFGTQFHAGDYIRGGIPLINPKHIQNLKIVEDNDMTVSKRKYAELPNYHLKVGDIIMARRGEMARCALVTKRENGWFCGTGSLYIRPSKEFDSTFLLYVLSSASIKERLENDSQGVTMSNLNQTIINNLELSIPPLPLQQQFAGIVAQGEQLRQKQRESERELENLFQGLLQRYFG